MTDIYFTKGHTDFTKTEQKIINYIIENPDSFVHMTIGDAARAIGSSEPTISRFARHCGYADFKELKSTVLQHLSGTDSPAGKLNSTIAVHQPAHREAFFFISSSASKKRLHFLILTSWSRRFLPLQKLKSYIYMPKVPPSPWPT